MAMVKRKHDNGQEIEYYIHDQVKEKILDKAIDQVHNKNNSFVAVFDARSGTGKTTLAIQYAKYLDPNFTIDQMTWQPKKIIEMMHNSEEHQCFVLDEAMGLNSRSAISALNKAIIIALSQIRSRNIFILICINSIFDLDKNIAIHRADLLFHLYCRNDTIDGERRVKVYGRHKLKYLYLTGKKYYNYSSPPNFFARPPRKYVFLLNEKEYEKRKRAATMEDANLDGNTIGKHETRYKIIAAKLIMYLKSKGMLQKDCADYLNEDKKNISKIVVWAKDHKYLEDMNEAV